MSYSGLTLSDLHEHHLIYISSKSSLNGAREKTETTDTRDFEDAVTALCTVCKNGGLTDRDTLDLAGDLLEAGRGADWITGFGTWYAKHKQGRPYLKHLRSFADDYEAGEVPFFAKPKPADADALIGAIHDLARAGATWEAARESLANAGLLAQYESLGIRWADMKRKTEAQIDALRWQVAA